MGFYTNITSEIAGTSLELFGRKYSWRKPIRSIGISVTDLAADTIPSQANLYCDEMERDRKEQLDHAVDWLKNRFGSYAVQPAVLMIDRRLSGFDPKKDHTIHPVGYF